MGLLGRYFNNTRKPDGVMGKMMLVGMNVGHAAVSSWGLSHIADLGPTAIAELGCGGGRTAAELLRKYPKAQLVALDYSQASVEKTRKVNQVEVDAGRCRVVQGDVAHLPFQDSQFDLVAAFETVYFWPGPVSSFREVHRVLRPGGTFLIVNESDGLNPREDKWTRVIDSLKIYTPSQLRDFLEEAGFSEMQIDHDSEKGWLALRSQR